MNNNIDNIENIINPAREYLQELLLEAASYRKRVSSAKTQTTKKFYQKKLDKITPKIQKLVVQLNYLTSATQKNNH